MKRSVTTLAFFICVENGQKRHIKCSLKKEVIHMTKRNIKTKSGMQSVPKSINDMDLSGNASTTEKKAEKKRPN